MTPYSVSFVNRLSRKVGRPLFKVFFHLLSDIKVFGWENVPSKGAYIIAVNHGSLFEPPLILTFWPTPPEAAGAIEVWRRPGQGLLARLYGGIPVHRGEFDRQLLDTMISALQSDRPLLLAPEGGRSHQPGIRRAHPGIAYIADKTGVPVIPVGVVGTSDDLLDRAFHLKRPRLEIRIGKPFTLPAVVGKGAERRQALQANADQIMVAITALMPSEYRGVYQAPNEAR